MKRLIAFCIVIMVCLSACSPSYKTNGITHIDDMINN